LRSPTVSRLYLQVRPDEDLAEWSDARIWDELAARFATDDGWKLHEGPITDRSVTPMRSFVAEPLRHDRLFLAGDAGHIVPPTGAKGLNLAVSDVIVLARAFAERYASGSETLLDGYSDTVLRRVWMTEHFSYWMTHLLHVDPAAGDFERRLQRAHLDYVVSSEAARTALAENYVGLPITWPSGASARAARAVSPGPEGGGPPGGGSPGRAPSVSSSSATGCSFSYSSSTGSPGPAMSSAEVTAPFRSPAGWCRTSGRASRSPSAISLVISPERRPRRSSSS